MSASSALRGKLLPRRRLALLAVPLALTLVAALYLLSLYPTPLSLLSPWVLPGGRPEAGTAEEQAAAAAAAAEEERCPNFEIRQLTRPGPVSAGRRRFPYVRPPPECRTFPLPALEALVSRVERAVRDPDLFRLFENSFLNTLDTAALWRGVIGLQARYVRTVPCCHAFQPPRESRVPPTPNAAYSANRPDPPYNPLQVFDCKWELDSLAAFLRLSADCFAKTGDAAFFGRARRHARERRAGSEGDVTVRQGKR